MIIAILAAIAMVLVILDIIPATSRGPLLQVAVRLLSIALCLPLLHLH